MIQDVFAALVLVGIGIAFYIRKVQRPDRFKGSHLREADYILLWIARHHHDAVRDQRDVDRGHRRSDRARGVDPLSNALSKAFERLSPAALDAVARRVPVGAHRC